MATLFGQKYSRHDLQGYTGNLAQVGGIRPFELAAGRERGVRGFDLITGTGFEITALADRALDLTRATFRGRSLSFHSALGQAHPAYYDPHGVGFLHSFPGGLLTTCGLRNVGSPCMEQGEEFGLHGRIGHLPMEELGYWGEWVGNEYWMYLKGAVTEGVMFGNSLRLTRQLSARLGGNTILIEDTVENLGGEATPHMLLYHCNLGFPVLSPDAQLVTPSRTVTPRDAAAAEGLATAATFQPPTPGYAEQVFYHEMETDTAGDVRVALVNPALDGGLGVFIKYHKKTLPNFIQWKQMGHGTYVLGLEPANCQVEGRCAERERGTLPVLQPGEVRAYRLEIGVLDGLQAIEEFTQAVHATA
ncbi:MAG TPA: aldose 1-epimerase family protein [Armatimonadota bacterium]|jgi:hypothetical protein